MGTDYDQVAEWRCLVQCDVSKDKIVRMKETGNRKWKQNFKLIR